MSAPSCVWMARVLAWFASWFTASWSFAFSSPMTVLTDVTMPFMESENVDLGYAQYQGRFDERRNMTQFLGVRYAAPPLGNLRFQAPQPPIFEPGVQPATQDPSMCYQTSFSINITPPVSRYGYAGPHDMTPTASEDCLFLNVFVPGTMSTESGGLPVVVWIYGGAYESGYAGMYNGAALVTGSLHTAIVVVVQYRIGAFGFLAGNEVQAQGALNAGLLDQDFALQWVQAHIGLFGGDKTKVTIWGESAGAGSVLQHIVANGGNTQPPLFKAAITSSIFFPSQYYYNDLVPQSSYNDVVDLTGCASSADTFTCLQSVEAETLESASNALGRSTFYGTTAFAPVVDGTFILERPTVTLNKGRVNGQVLLAVSNWNEGAPFVDVNMPVTLTIADFVSQLFPGMTSREAQEAAVVYRNYGSTFEQAVMVMTESIFVCPTYNLLQAFAGRSWKGVFAIPPAYHALDLLYYFYSLDEPPLYDDAAFVAAFSQSFASLAKHYDVNVKLGPDTITPRWDEYAVGHTEMLFNRTEDGVPIVKAGRTDPELLDRCAFWSSVASLTAQ